MLPATDHSDWSFVGRGHHVPLTPSFLCFADVLGCKAFMLETTERRK